MRRIFSIFLLLLFISLFIPHVLAESASISASPSTPTEYFPPLSVSRSKIARIDYGTWNDRYKDICEVFSDSTRYLFHIDQNGISNLFSITTKDGCEFSLVVGKENFLIPMAIARIPHSVFKKEGILPADITYLFAPFINYNETESVTTMKDINVLASLDILSQSTHMYTLIGSESPAELDYDLYILSPEYKDVWVVMIQNCATLDSVISLLQ